MTRVVKVLADFKVRPGVVCLAGSQLVMVPNVAQSYVNKGLCAFVEPKKRGRPKKVVAPDPEPEATVEPEAEPEPSED